MTASPSTKVLYNTSLPPSPYHFKTIKLTTHIPPTQTTKTPSKSSPPSPPPPSPTNASASSTSSAPKSSASTSKSPLALDETMTVYERILKSALGSGAIPMASSSKPLSPPPFKICSTVITCFGLNTPRDARGPFPHLQDQPARRPGQQTWPCSWPKGWRTLSLLCTVGSGGMPFFPAVNGVEMCRPSCRPRRGLFSDCSCAILILDADEGVSGGLRRGCVGQPAGAGC